MKRASAWTAAVLLLTASASVETLRNAQGEGVKRAFRQSYAIVCEAAFDAAPKRKLEVAEQDPKKGRTVLASGPTSTSLGERIVLFLRRAGARATSVETALKAVVPATFPRDWPLLFGDIEQNLAMGSGTR